MTSVQDDLKKQITTFLEHRGVIATEESNPLGGWQAKKHPESFVLLQAEDTEIFVYEDGQTELRKNGAVVFNLEIEAFKSVQAHREKLFSELTGIFGNYK